MDLPVFHPDTGHRVRLHAAGHSTCADVIQAVVREFVLMGMDPRDTAAEISRLRTDPTYFASWVSQLPDWCPSLARYDSRPRRRLFRGAALAPADLTRME